MKQSRFRDPDLQKDFFSQFGDFYQRLEQIQTEAAKKKDFAVSPHEEIHTLCVTNGFLGHVDQCRFIKSIGFDVTRNRGYVRMERAGFGIQCLKNGKPCALMTGIDPKGFVGCSKNSTKLCTSEQKITNLVTARIGCRTKKDILVGKQKINCSLFEEVLVGQMQEFDSQCEQASYQVQQLCNNFYEDLKKIIKPDLKKIKQKKLRVLRPKNNRVVVIGDSHLACTPYAKEIHQCLSKKSWQTLLLGRNGASPRNWQMGRFAGIKDLCGYNMGHSKIDSSSPEVTWGIKEVLQKKEAGTVIIHLGDNILHCAHSYKKDCVSNYFKSLLKTVKSVSKSTQCILVTPTFPTKENQASKTTEQAFYLRDQILKAARAYKCGAIDGIELMRDQTGATHSHLIGGDGVHMTKDQSRLFGERVCDELDKVLKK